MAVTSWQITDGKKRNMWQNPTTFPFYTWPVAPNWKIGAGGQLTQTLIADGTSTTSGPIFVYQGLRMYDRPVAWIPDGPYTEKPYHYVVPINFVANTVDPPSILQQHTNTIINNFPFKLRRISIAYHQGPTNTAALQWLGMRLYDWQDRILMSDYIPASYIDFNGRDLVGQNIYGPHANFPAWPLLYPVNGRIGIDLTDLLAQASGSISDIQGSILFEGVNLIPCASTTPGAIVPDDGRLNLYGGGVTYPLPYFYCNSMFQETLNQVTFMSQAPFTTAIDGDSDFWMTAAHKIVNPS